MKKIFATITGAFMLGAAVFTSACSSAPPAVPEEGTLELPHFNGLLTSDVDKSLLGDGTYDTDLLYYGENRIWGADEGVIWVSEEQGGPEYGGYFYMYIAGTGGGVNDKGQSTEVLPDGRNMMVLCFRSRDLNDWKLCGAIENGWSLELEKDTWVGSALWAAEVMYNPTDGKYYMYFTARTRDNDGSIEGATYSNFDSDTTKDKWGRFSAGIACSDTPVGPFRMVTSERNYNGGPNLNDEIITDVNPTFDIAKSMGFNNDEDKFPFIDPHPVFIDDGNPNTYDLYLFFARHMSTYLGYDGNTIWGVKMQDPASPDWSTLTYLLGHSYSQTVTYNDAGSRMKDSSYTIQQFKLADGSLDKNNNRGTVCEAPTLLTRDYTDENGNVKTKYYLMTSPHGVGAVNYDVDIAVADSPLGPYTKIAYENGGKMLALDENNDFMSNLGHCSVVQAGDESFCVFGNSLYYGADVYAGRFYAFSGLTWYFEESLGYEMPIVNGPMRSLQPRPAVASGYSNVASKGSIEVRNFDGETTKYLTDGLIPTQGRLKHMQALTNGKQASVSFIFDTPVILRGILVYNSYDYWTAFKKIDYITFNLAEAVQIGTETSHTVAIKDLPFDSAYYDSERQIMRPGGASVATFNEIKVSSVTITLSAPIDTDATELNIGEIVLLGK